MTGPKFINIYGLCWCCGSFELFCSWCLLVLVLVLPFVTNSSAAQTHLLILKFRAGVVSFLTPRRPRTLNQSTPVPRSRLSPVIARCCHCHAHTYYIFYAHIILHTHPRTHCTMETTLFRCGWVRDPTWHHKGWDEVNRITYTNYHRHCAPAFKNIYLLISFEVTPQKLSSFIYASNWVKFLIEIRQYDNPVYDWDASCAPFWMQIDTFVGVACLPSD